MGCFINGEYIPGMKKCKKGGRKNEDKTTQEYSELGQAGRGIWHAECQLTTKETESLARRGNTVTRLSGASPTQGANSSGVVLPNKKCAVPDKGR